VKDDTLVGEPAQRAAERRYLVYASVTLLTDHLDKLKFVGHEFGRFSPRSGR